MVGKRPRRNEPCPCGSGRKYKSCCRGRKRDPFGAIREKPRSLKGEMTGVGPRRVKANKAKRDLQDNIQGLKDHMDYLDRFQARSTEDIILTLRGFGLVFDEDRFKDQIEGQISSYDVAKEHYIDQGHSAKGWDEDLIPIGIEELWKRLLPDRYNIEMVVDAVRDGYRHIEDDRDREALVSWEKAWSIVKALRPPDVTSVDDLMVYFKDMVSPSMNQWLIDFETELGNEGRDDHALLERRLALVKEVMDLFPGSDPSFLASLLRSEAETHSMLGHIDEAERLFAAAVERFPVEVVLYLGWGDMYGHVLWDLAVPLDLDRAEAIYERGLEAVEGDEDLLEERLGMLSIYRQMEQK